MVTKVDFVVLCLVSVRKWIFLSNLRNLPLAYSSPARSLEQV